jgi:hypothetical protein
MVLGRLPGRRESQCRAAEPLTAALGRGSRLSCGPTAGRSGRPSARRAPVRISSQNWKVERTWSAATLAVGFRSTLQPTFSPWLDPHVDNLADDLERPPAGAARCPALNATRLQPCGRRHQHRRRRTVLHRACDAGQRPGGEHGRYPRRGGSVIPALMASRCVGRRRGVADLSREHRCPGREVVIACCGLLILVSGGVALAVMNKTDGGA